METRRYTSLGLELFRYARAILIFVGTPLVLVVAWHFPKDIDQQEPTQSEIRSAKTESASSYYEGVYAPPDSSGSKIDGADSGYVEFNRAAAHESGIKEGLTRFVTQYGLQDSKTLEVGAGSGTLQDIVEDYTGLDIAASASRYFHKPFVQGSATDLPFNDSSFDLIWTVWTIEHVPQPERAFLEMRRVARNGGILFLFPAWNVPVWAPQGLAVRPYGGLGWGDKISKSTLSFRDTGIFMMSYQIPIRSLRWLYWKSAGRPTSLRYTRLEPNYEKYWQADSDAVNSLDSFETLLWFISRGDQCLNCDTLTSEIGIPHDGPVIIRVSKP